MFALGGEQYALPIDRERIEAVPPADTHTIDSITEIEGRLVVLLNPIAILEDLVSAAASFAAAA